MNLSRFQTMDPNLLPGLLNTALRNEFESLEDLAKTHDLDEQALLKRIEEIGYEYRADINQSDLTGLIERLNRVRSLT